MSDDSDLDGHVTRVEFKGPPALFDRIDRNRDGMLTKADFEQEVPPIEGFKLDGDKWTFEDKDLSIHGILLKPDGDGPFPAIVISHGAEGSAEDFALPKAKEMVKWGFVCIGPTYTHTIEGPRRDAPSPIGQIEGEPTKVANQVPAARKLRSDVGASPENIRRAIKCVEILESLPYVDRKRIYAYGNSMGAFVTIGLAAAIPDRIAACAITAGGVDKTHNIYPSIEEAERIRSPFMIIHGGSDKTVPPERSLWLKEVLDKNKVPNERHVFEGIPHPVHRIKSDEVFQLMRDWFEKQGILRK